MPPVLLSTLVRRSENLSVESLTCHLVIPFLSLSNRAASLIPSPLKSAVKAASSVVEPKPSIQIPLLTNLLPAAIAFSHFPVSLSQYPASVRPSLLKSEVIEDLSVPNPVIHTFSVSINFFPLEKATFHSPVDLLNSPMSPRESPLKSPPVIVQLDPPNPLSQVVNADNFTPSLRAIFHSPVSLLYTPTSVKRSPLKFPLIGCQLSEASENVPRVPERVNLVLSETAILISPVLSLYIPMSETPSPLKSPPTGIQSLESPKPLSHSV